MPFGICQESLLEKQGVTRCHRKLTAVWGINGREYGSRRETPSEKWARNNRIPSN